MALARGYAMARHRLALVQLGELFIDRQIIKIQLQ